MNRRFAALGLLFALSGCAGQLAGGLLQNPSQLSGAAAGVFGLPAATVASQVSAEITEITAIAASLQMLRAQLDGIPVTLPPLPPVTGTTITPTPSPTPTPTPMPPPTLTPPTPPAPSSGPIVTPNSRRRASTSQRRFDFSGSTFKFDADGRPVPLQYGVASIQ
jgi:hypothetical protein